MGLHVGGSTLIHGEIHQEHPTVGDSRPGELGPDRRPPPDRRPLRRKPLQDAVVAPNPIAQRSAPLRPIVRTDGQGFGKKPKEQQRNEA
ncbi:MAG: hypothetical protein NTY19_28475 [Planctomycetota bacterium]|nr:hypothetical protein [Planctomycetota bacterium]